MKKLIKAALVAVMAFGVSATYAQKMGRVNSQEIVMAMPETATMQTNLETFRKDLSDNLETMQVEFNNKFAEYQSNLKTYTDSIRGLKETELQDLQNRMKQFENTAMQEIQAKQAELLEPIVTKARDAISKVATAGGYDVVYDMSTGSLAFVNESTVVDLAPQVRAELGISETPATPAQ